jgi:hypothetical protein
MAINCEKFSKHYDSFDSCVSMIQNAKGINLLTCSSHNKILTRSSHNSSDMKWKQSIIMAIIEFSS